MSHRVGILNKGKGCLSGRFWGNLNFSNVEEIFVNTSFISFLVPLVGS